MNDDKELERALLAISIKYDNQGSKILDVVSKGITISTTEIENTIKDVEEKYTVIISKDYPDYFKSLDNPPFVAYYEGNLELFNNNGGYFISPLDENKGFYLAVSEYNNDQGEMDWCLAVDQEKDLLPLLNVVINDLSEHFTLKKYSDIDGLSLS